MESTLHVVRPELAEPRGVTDDQRRLHFLPLDYSEFYVEDPVLGWRTAPNAHRRFERGGISYEYRINSHGMHSPERELVPPPGVFRILLLGDSQAITQVSLADSHPHLTQECLNARRAAGDLEVQMLNYGVAGYGFSQYLSMLERFGLAFQPDLVLVQVNPSNDYGEEFPQFMDYLWSVPARYRLENHQLVAHYAPLQVDADESSTLHDALYAISALYRFYANALSREFYTNRGGVLASFMEGLGISPPGLPVVDLAGLIQRVAELRRGASDNYAAVGAMLARMRAVAHASGAELAMFANPRIDNAVFEPDEPIARMAEKLDIPFLALIDRIPAHVEPGVPSIEQLTFLPEEPDPHFDLAGNRVVGRIVCDWLSETGLVARGGS